MTNAEMIAKAAFLAGVTEEAHTFAHWQQSGYSVRKGEHAAFSCPIWKMIHKRDKKTGKSESQFVMAKGFFFTRSQVELIPAESVTVYNDAGEAQKVLVSKAGKEYTVRFPNEKIPCMCSSMEAVQMEIVDYCKYAGLSMALGE